MKKRLAKCAGSNDLIKQNNNSIMGKIALFILCLFIIFSFTACSNDDNIPRNSTNENPNRSSASSEQPDSASIEQTDKEGTNNTECNDSMNISADKISVTRSAHVIKNFYVISGAVIYHQTYDEYGYPDCCYFRKKCDFCGNVGENGSARGNITSGYTCPKCKKTNRVEIKADFEWIEVND